MSERFDKLDSRAFLIQTAEVGKFNDAYDAILLGEVRALVDKCMGMSDDAKVYVKQSESKSPFKDLIKVCGIRIDSFIKEK